MEKYISFLKESGADLAMQVDAASVVTAAWTIYRCRFGCDFFGKSRCCPPHTPTCKETREMLDCYRSGILFRCRDISKVRPLAVALAKELFLDGYYKVIAFASGPCDKCKSCNSERCNFPKEALPSMEGCGIDVFATARANGIEIHTLREKGEEASFFGLVMVE